jgi:hypothetical protein
MNKKKAADIATAKQRITGIRKTLNESTDAQVKSANFLQNYIDNHTTEGAKPRKDLIEVFAKNKKAWEQHTIQLLGYLEEVEIGLSYLKNT